MRAARIGVIAVVLVLASSLAAGAGAQAGPEDGDQRPDWGAGFDDLGDANQQGTDQEGGQSFILSPFGRADREGDARYAKGDLKAIRVEHRDTVIRLTVNTVTASDAATDVAWTDGVTFVEWAVDVNALGVPEFFAGLYNNGSEVVAEVVRNNASFTHQCFGTVLQSSGTTFKMEFPRSCVSSPPTIRVASRMFFDKFPAIASAPVSEDYSPNSTYTPLIKRNRDT